MYIMNPETVDQFSALRGAPVAHLVKCLPLMKAEYFFPSHRAMHFLSLFNYFLSKYGRYHKKNMFIIVCVDILGQLVYITQVNKWNSSHTGLTYVGVHLISEY